MAEEKLERKLSITVVLEDGYKDDHLHLSLKAAIESLKGVKRVEAGDYEQVRSAVIEALQAALMTVDKQHARGAF